MYESLIPKARPKVTLTHDMTIWQGTNIAYGVSEIECGARYRGVSVPATVGLQSGVLMRGDCLCGTERSQKVLWHVGPKEGRQAVGALIYIFAVSMWSVPS